MTVTTVNNVAGDVWDMITENLDVVGDDGCGASYSCPGHPAVNAIQSSDPCDVTVNEERHHAES